MAKKDGYIATLSNTIIKIENAYGMQKMRGSTPIADLPIVDVITYFNKVITSCDKEELGSINVAAGREVVLLSYVTQRMVYYNKKRLDYSKYKNMRTITKVLFAFTKQKTTDKKTLRSVNKIITLLDEIDKRHVSYRNALSYRFLRIFVVMIMHGNYCNASVVADFILNQIITKENAI